MMLLSRYPLSKGSKLATPFNETSKCRSSARSLSRSKLREKDFGPLPPVVEKNFIVLADKSIVTAITSVAISPEVDERDFRECYTEFSKLIFKTPVIFMLLLKQRGVFLLFTINGMPLKGESTLLTMQNGQRCRAASIVFSCW